MTAPLSADTLRGLETLALPVPLAARLHDVATGALVSDGLALTAAPLAADGETETARPQALRLAGSGTHVALRLPGIALPPIQPAGLTGDLGFMAQPKKPFRLRASDGAGRFLPLLGRHSLPAHDAAGWPGWAGLNALPPAQRPGVRRLLGNADGAATPTDWPLFSAPGRANPGALAEIRCNLEDGDGGPAPAWALIGAEHDGQLIGLGLADAMGAAVLFMAWPPLPPAMPIPPPGFAWPISIRCWWGKLKAAAVPDLAAVLGQFASPARVYEQQSPLRLLPPQPLRPGRALILRTATPRGNSTLLIRAA